MPPAAANQPPGWPGDGAGGASGDRAGDRASDRAGGREGMIVTQASGAHQEFVSVFEILSDRITALGAMGQSLGGPGAVLGR